MILKGNYSVTVQTRVRVQLLIKWLWKAIIVYGARACAIIILKALKGNYSVTVHARVRMQLLQIHSISIQRIGFTDA